MDTFFVLVILSIHLSQALLLPSNSSILQLPSQDPALNLTTGEKIHLNDSLTHNPWPDPPYEREIKNGLDINITAYGDSLSAHSTPIATHALLMIHHIIQNDGWPDDILNDITNVGLTRGDVYTEIGFYALRPSKGIKRYQAEDVLYKIWELLIEFYPPREITKSEILVLGGEVALFRMSFRENVGGSGG